MEYALIILVYYAGLSTSNATMTSVPVQSLKACQAAAVELRQQIGERNKTICIKVKE